MSRLHKIAAASILIAILVLALKAGAWWVTGSIALFSESTESLVNLASALAAFIAVWLASRPADTRHPFGFHKAELLSALFGGTLITLAAVIILRESVAGLFDPQPVSAMVTGLLLSALGSTINALWCYVLITEGRKLRSPALQADGRHLLSDVLFSAAVIIGLVASSLTGWLILDPLIAGLVALNVLRTGLSVVLSALRGLLDESLPEAELQKIRAVILAEAGEGITMRDLRTRHAGAACFIEFRLILPGGMTVATAHRLTQRITHALEQAAPSSQIIIHIEADRAGATPFSVIDGGRKDHA